MSHTGGGGFQIGSIHVGNDQAMRYTAVFAAIRLRSENIASLPKIITEYTSNGRVEATNHQMYRLLKFRPNAYMNVFNFWEYINACMDGWGNAYVLIKRLRNGSPQELIPIHPSLVTPYLKNGKKWYFVGGTQDYDGRYSDDDMLHFFSLSKDGITGINPISYNSAAISSGISAQDFGNEFFEKKGNVKAVLETDSKMEFENMKSFVKAFNYSNNFGTPILDQGVKYKQVGIAPEAAQMLQTRTFALQDIARIFNVPPHLLADLSHATFSNIEHQDIQFVKYSIRPSVKRYETEMQNKLLFEDEFITYEIKFNLDGMLRGDTKTRAEYYQRAIQNGWMSRNEVRELENMNPSDGLDAMLYPASLNVVGEENNNTTGDE